MSRIDEALVFASNAHMGQVRKVNGVPYIIHPMEVASIIASMTSNEDVIIAGLLHDTIEDCDVDPAEIKAKFGAKVAAIVQSESEDKLADLPPEATWKQRKEESLLMLEHTKNLDVKILWLADKLANIRSYYQGYQNEGDAVWLHFHQKDPKEHKWYYESCLALLSDLENTLAYQELKDLVNKLFGGM